MVTGHECQRCGQRLFRAPDGNWVTASEDVICRYDGDPETRWHVPVPVDDGRPEPPATVIAVVDDGTVDGVNVGNRQVALLHRRAGTDTATYIGHMEWQEAEGRGRWRVWGTGDWDYVDTSAGYGENVRDAVRLLYTAYQVSLLTTTSERGGE